MGSPGRIPKPPRLKIVEGRGTRKRDGVPTDSGGRPVEVLDLGGRRGVPLKPVHLSADASWLWDQVVEQMESVGLLKPVDGPALEVVCETFSRWREAVRLRRSKELLGRNSQGVVAAPWVGIEERASRDFRSWCTEFGFTPASEGKIVGELSNAQQNGGSGNPF